MNMKNTSFEVPIVPLDMRELLNQWESEGYAVIRTIVTAQKGRGGCHQRFVVRDRRGRASIRTSGNGYRRQWNTNLCCCKM